jgi:hypothetical protein
MNEFDKAGRYLVKQDPANLFPWLWRFAATPLAFHSWLDARRLALPVEGDLTCDTVAALHLAGQAEPTHALIVELMAESRSNLLDRLLGYVTRAQTEPAPEAVPGPRLQVGGAVINFTGPAQARAVQVSFPGVSECDWGFGILQRTLRDEPAAATLAAIAAGRTTRWLLPWIPLMQGGAEAGIMEQWKEVAVTEPDRQVRSTLGAFALLFAELADRAETWTLALEGWEMRPSQVVEEWRNEGRVEGRAEGRNEGRAEGRVEGRAEGRAEGRVEGRAEGRVEGRAEGRVEGQLEVARLNLLALLRKKFGTVPEELVQRVQAVTDVARLQAALQQVLDIQALDELQL